MLALYICSIRTGQSYQLKTKMNFIARCSGRHEKIWGHSAGERSPGGGALFGDEPLNGIFIKSSECFYKLKTKLGDPWQIMKSRSVFPAPYIEFLYG